MHDTVENYIKISVTRMKTAKTLVLNMVVQQMLAPSILDSIIVESLIKKRGDED